MKRFKYIEPTGEKIVLEVLWESHTGRIPPPVIVFESPTEGQLRFKYQGEE